MEQNKEARKNRQMFTVLLIFGSVLACASLLLRSLTAGNYAIQTVDLIFLVIPLLVVALATGKLRSLDFFGLKADFSDLWAAVGRTEIRNQVSGLTPSTWQDAVDVDILERARKSSLEELPQLIAHQPEVLEFKLGHGNYSGEVIAEYFKALSGRLRVVVVNDQYNKLFGIYNATDLISSLRFSEGEEGESYRLLERLLNAGRNQEARATLATLPGFVSADNAVTEVTSKRDALAKMDELDTDILPVVNEEGRFIGTVRRAKLTAGLILAVTNELEGR